MTRRAVRPRPVRRPQSGGWRVLRAGVLGTASLGLGTAAHLAGGGRSPTPGVALVAALVLAMVAVTLTARRCRFPVLVAVLGLEQLALHAVFTWAGHGSLVAGSSHAGHGVGTLLVAGPGTPDFGVAATAGTTAGTTAGMAGMLAAGPAMLIGHALATVAIAWLLAYGESLLWRLADRVIRATGVLRRRPAALRRPVVARLVPRFLGPLHPTAPRRGPPLVLAAP